MTRGARGRTLNTGPIVLDATAGINRAASERVRRYRDIRDYPMRTGCNLRYIRFPLRPRPRSAIRCLRAVISLCPRGARTSFDIDYRVPYALLRVVCRGRRRAVVRPTFCCRVMSLATPSSSTGILTCFAGDVEFLANQLIAWEPVEPICSFS